MEIFEQSKFTFLKKNNILCDRHLGKKQKEHRHWIYKSNVGTFCFGMEFKKMATAFSQQASPFDGTFCFLGNPNPVQNEYITV